MAISYFIWCEKYIVKFMLHLGAIGLLRMDSNSRHRVLGSINAQARQLAERHRDERKKEELRDDHFGFLLFMLISLYGYWGLIRYRVPERQGLDSGQWGSSPDCF